DPRGRRLSGVRLLPVDEPVRLSELPRQGRRQADPGRTARDEPHAAAEVLARGPEEDGGGCLADPGRLARDAFRSEKGDHRLEALSRQYDQVFRAPAGLA